MSCLENASKLEQGFGKSFITCGVCNSPVWCRELTYFIHCHAENPSHYYCLVCNLLYNQSNHDECILLFSYTTPNI